MSVLKVAEATMEAGGTPLTVLFPDILSVSIYMILPRSTWVAAEKNDCLNVIFSFKLLNHFKSEKKYYHKALR